MGYFKDPVIWIAIVATFILLVFTEGCVPFRWTDKGTKLEYPVSDTVSICGKATGYRVQVTLRKTF